MAKRLSALPHRRLRAPRLDWEGREDPRVLLCAADGEPRRIDPRRLPEPQLVPLERVGMGDSRVLWGDCYLAHRALLASGWAGRFKLAYLDPPFNTGRRFEHYDDDLAIGDWLCLMRDRLVQVRELLADDGLLVVHLDDHRVHHARLLLDELFGVTNFRNSLVIKRVYKNLGRQFERVQALPLAHDVCLLYSKNPATRWPLPELPKPDGPRHPEGYWKDFWSTADRPTMRYELLGVQPLRGQWKWCRERAEQAVENHRRYLAEADGEPLVAWWRRHGARLEFIKLSESGRVVHWVPPLATQCADTLWCDIRGYSFRHRFPTEKSESLLERLLLFFSQPGDWVLDSFAGSGTTGAAATRLGRRFVLIELGDQARTRVVPRLRAAGAEFGVDQVR